MTSHALVSKLRNNNGISSLATCPAVSDALPPVSIVLGFVLTPGHSPVGSVSATFGYSPLGPVRFPPSFAPVGTSLRSILDISYALFCPAKPYSISPLSFAFNTSAAFLYPDALGDKDLKSGGPIAAAITAPSTP